MKKTLPILIALLLVASSMCAKTITVTSSADSGAGTLRQAVLDANANDSIIFDSSVTSITLSTVIRLEKNITITGNKNSTTTITMLAPNSRHFVLSNTGVTTTLSNLTLKDGYFYTCGGSMIIAPNNNVILNNCFFKNNKSGDFAGAIQNAGTLKINNCLFDNNTCNSNGIGAISNSGEAYINNTIFTNNYGSDQGSLYNHNGGSIILNNCLFKGNKGNYAGLTNRGIAVVINCLFTGNTSNAGTVINYKLDNLDPKTTSLTITNSTIVDNVGVGIYNDQQLKLYNSIVTNNNATQDIYNDSIGTITATNNLIGSSNLNLSGNGNILNTDPLFVGNGDYSLQKSSPAINMGSNSYLPDTITTDIAGHKRISNNTIDMGAYEYQSPSAVLLYHEAMQKIYSHNQTICIENGSSSVSIFNTMGQLVAQGVKTEFTMPIAGVYIVRVGNNVQKVIVK
ncbi:MAG: choice-of-anchor Q domain-containing protein [Paludibacteraceae bacterium]|nr:choice-of-anchor Q domain-containing protein [Paludibacteraceae bacterium]